MLRTKCSGRSLCQRCERWWSSRSCFLLIRCQNRWGSFIQVVVAFMSSVWYKQIRHSADAKSTCGIALNTILMSILIFKYRWMLSLQKRATGIVLETDALTSPAEQKYTCSRKQHTLSLTLVGSNQVWNHMWSSVFKSIYLRAECADCLQFSKLGPVCWCFQPDG